MIYREERLEKATLLEGDICKECLLIDCIIADGVHLEKCLVVNTKKKTKKKTNVCKTCEDGEPCEDCNEVKDA